MEQTFNIEGLFPVPMYTAQFPRTISNEEFAAVKSRKHEIIKNVGNISSKDSNVLQLTQLKELKDWIYANLQNFIQKIYQPKHNITCEITESWVNFTGANSYHHEHLHPNSIISGVYYFKTTGPSDSIIFSKYVKSYYVENIGFTPFNVDSISVNVNPGKLILFPSDLLHSVPKNTTTNERVSLSFNTFFKGTLSTRFATSLEL